jgi:signal transduction histidine kinase/class 3 adenylate cyclase/CheY-like chemotaxis protein
MNRPALLIYPTLLLLLLVGVVLPVLGQRADSLPLFSIDSLQDQIHLSGQVRILEDQEGKMKLAEVRKKKSDFAPVDSFSQPLPHASTWWGYLRLQNKLSQPTDWVLNLGYPNFAEVYYSTPDSGFLLKKSGLYAPSSEKEIIYGKMQKVRLHFEAGEQKEVYLKIQEIDHAPPSFENLALFELGYWKYWKASSNEIAYIIMGIFSGMLLIIILYNIILYFTTHTEAHIYYALYLASVLFFSLFATNILENIPSEIPRIYPHLGFLSLALVSIFYFQFGRTFLNTRELTPRWDRYIRIYIYIKIAILLLEQLILFTTFHVEVVADLEFAVMIGDAIASLLFIFRLLKTKSRLARFFIAGSSCVMIFAFSLTVLSIIFHLPDAFLFFLVAVVVEILIFSLGLGYKIKMSEEEKLKAQEALTQQLLEADKLKDDFLANTSHELRTPLNGIIGLAESLYDGAAGEVNAPMKKNLGMIIASGRRLTNLVNDLLDFSKLKSVELDIQQKPIDMHALADVVILISEPLIGPKSLKIYNEVSEDLPAVLGDENRLQQIMLNLLGNAIKFTEKGEVRIGAKVEGDMLRTWVQDTGIGIPKEKQGRIFQSFEQGDGSISRQYGGTGLGLSITKKLVELHGGEIGLESEQGVGSTFYFTLPTSSEKAESSYELSQELQHLQAIQQDFTQGDTEALALGSSFGEGEEGEAVRILLVDDEPVNQQVLINHLSMGNYEVYSAMNGEEALEAIEREEAFDLVLLDIMMPRMSGYEVCQKIREKYLPSELPVIMITAKNQVSDLVQGFSFGANDYLTKPFSKDEFLARIRTHLNLMHINSAYGRFVPREFLKALGQESIIDIRLGDQVEKEVTVFFSDIRSYTTLAESMTPQENFGFINAYLGRMGPVIQENRGFVNQYYGDGIMALFLRKPDDALRAAVEMKEALRKYNAERTAKGRDAIRVGMGLHTGPLMLGIIGDQLRMEAGVVSDTVNTAARMEGLTKAFGVNVVVSQDTLDAMKSEQPDLKYRFLGKVLVKGKLEPIGIYDLYDGDSEAEVKLKESIQPDFDRAVTAYYAGDFSTATEAFEAVLAQAPQEVTARRYLAKSSRLLEEGTPEGWDGVEEMMSK